MDIADGDRCPFGDAESGAIQLVQSLLAPALSAMRESRGRKQSQNNLKQLALALHNYHDGAGHLPPQATTDKDGRKLMLHQAKNGFVYICRDPVRPLSEIWHSLRRFS